MTTSIDTPVEETRGELVLADEHAPITLFGTSDPTIALERMAKVAGALMDVIETKRLYADVNRRRHITSEGWTTLGGMLGVVPIVAWTRPLDGEKGWEARVEARTLDGRIVGAAESMCCRTERNWRQRDEFALRSMAQTRAISRALRAPLGQIVVLAGYDPAGAEEIPVDAEEVVAAEPAAQPAGTVPNSVKPTGEQQAEIHALIARLGQLDPETDWGEQCREITGVPRWEMVTGTIAAMLIDRLRQLAADAA